MCWVRVGSRSREPSLSHRNRICPNRRWEDFGTRTRFPSISTRFVNWFGHYEARIDAPLITVAMGHSTGASTEPTGSTATRAYVGSVGSYASGFGTSSSNTKARLRGGLLRLPSHSLS